MDRTYNASPTRSEVTEFKVGIGTTSVAVGDTDLEHPIPISGTEQVDDCEATTGWTDNADTTLSVNSTTYKQGTKSLNWTKDGTGGADCESYKTTTSRDFTSKELSIWVYVKDATAYGKLATSNCLTIRFGSDSSNYYQWVKDKADLTSGQWNLFDNLTSSNADSTVGSPVIGACDYTLVKLTADASATVWSAGDFIVDDIKLISSGDYTKIFESGYPTINYTSLQASIRCRLSTVESNGYLISEFGIFNTDGTPLMESRDTFTSISKTSSDEIIFIAKNTIE